MAFSVISGGLSALYALGEIREDGTVVSFSDTAWQHVNNGNPTPSRLRNIAGVSSSLLFVVERDTNRNIVCYYGPTHNTNVTVEWLMIQRNADLDGHYNTINNDVYTMPLNMIESRLYGITMISPNEFTIRAMPDIVFTLIRTRSGNYRASMVIGTKVWILNHVMLCTTRLLGLNMPGVKEVHFTVECPDSGATKRLFFSTTP